MPLDRIDLYRDIDAATRFVVGDCECRVTHAVQVEPSFAYQRLTDRYVPTFEVRVSLAAVPPDPKPKRDMSIARRYGLRRPKGEK